MPPVLEDKEVTGVGGREGGVLGAISTHPTKSTEALQDLAVKEAGAGRVGQGLVQEVVDEVDARLHGEHHARLQVPGRAQALQAGLINPIHALGRWVGGGGRGEGSERGPRRVQPQARATTSAGDRWKRASVQDTRPCPCRHLHVGPGSGPLGPPGATGGSVTLGVSSPDSDLLGRPRSFRSSPLLSARSPRFLVFLLLVTPRTVPHGHLCTHPRHAAPADPGGWLRVRLPHPGPLPARGAVEAKPVKPKKLLGGCRASQAAAFFQAAGFQAEWKPALKCWAWLPTSRGPGFPRGFPGRGTGAVSRTPALARVCTDALSPCAWPGGVGREEHTGQLHTTPMCWASAEPWDWLSALPQRSQGRGQRGRWQLGHLQKSPCLPQVLEASGQ